jgi:hypothetical protein
MLRFFVFTAATGVLFFLFCLPLDAAALNATDLDVTAPSSVDINEGFSVTAEYTSNDTNLCDAVCSVSGGWISEPVYLSETPACEYSGTIYAPSYSDSYNLNFFCQKTGYDYKSVGSDIDVEKLDSYLSIAISPQQPYPGDTVNVYAYYVDDYDDSIQGSCRVELEEGGTEIEDTYMAYNGLHYREDFVMVSGTWDYSITVTCTSDQYETAAEEVDFDVRKQQADLSLSYSQVFYYGQDVEIKADYNHLGSLILGSCTISFDGEEKEMDYSHTGYSSTIGIPYAKGSFSLDVECSSANYETVEGGSLIIPVNRPARIVLVSPGQASFYPLDKIPVKVSYLDSLAGDGIKGARCSLDDSVQFRMEDGFYVAELSNLGIGTRSLRIECSEQFHEESIHMLEVDVVRIPLDIKFPEARSEYRYGEEIKINASVESMAGGDANVSCRARVDSYDLLFNNLFNYYTADMEQEEGMHALTLKDSGRPSRIVLTVTCSGDLYEEKTSRIEILTKQLSRKTEEGAIIVLSVVSLVLLALILLIRRKTKIF